MRTRSQSRNVPGDHEEDVALGSPGPSGTTTQPGQASSSREEAAEGAVWLVRSSSDSEELEALPPQLSSGSREAAEHEPEQYHALAPSDSADDWSEAEEYEDEDESEEGEGESEEEESTGQRNPVRRLMQLMGVSVSQQAQRFPRIPRGYVPPPLDHALAFELSTHSSASHPRHPIQLARPCKRRLLDASAITNPAHQLLAREGSLDGRGGRLSAAQRAHFVGTHRLPCRPSHLGDSMRSRGYIGQFTRSGDLFVAAFQNERRVKIYDVSSTSSSSSSSCPSASGRSDQCGGRWRCVKDVHARGLRWTVTDTCLSADQKFLLYASISATVHLVNVQRGQGEAAESIANVTDIHQPLEFASGEDGGSYSTGIWSLSWAADSSEIVAGTGDNSLYIYDVTAAKTAVRVEGHNDDVNAVSYVDYPSCRLIATGSDDGLVKIWDRRMVSGRRSRPAGVLVGHTEGITHIDPKGDGRYLISNSKDQSVKVWDMRSMRSAGEAAALRRDNARVPRFAWDYRWMEYPGRDRLISHPHDGSVMTLRGHSVLSTLIRAYWSPAETTGQRYVYTGSADGGVWVYDVLTGRVVTVLRYHREVVRDCSWHPHLPMLASVSFDGSICCWDPEVPGEQEMEEEELAAKRAKQAKHGGAGGRDRGRRPRLSVPAPGRDMLENW